MVGAVLFEDRIDRAAQLCRRAQAQRGSMHGLLAIGHAACGLAEILHQQHRIAGLQVGAIALEIERLGDTGNELGAARHLQLAAGTGPDNESGFGSDYGARGDFHTVTTGQLL